MIKNTDFFLIQNLSQLDENDQIIFCNMVTFIQITEQ